MFGNVVCIMTTRTATIDLRGWMLVVGVLGAAKTNCTGIAMTIVWLVVWTCGAVGLWTWNATGNATMWLQWCFRTYVLRCCDCCVFSSICAIGSVVFGTYSVCFMWLFSWITVSGFLFECLVFDELWLLTYMYGWQYCLYHDNANGINGFTAKNVLLVRTVL